MAAVPQAPKSATPITCAHNRSFLDALPFGDRADFEDAARGFIGTLPKVELRNADGRIVYSLEDYAFLAHEAGARHGQPEPVAAGPAQHEQRPVPGHRPHLSGARLRHLQHDDHRGQPRRHRHRPADLDGSRPRRPRALLAASRPQAGDGRDLQPQPCRPFRRRARRRRRGRGESRQRRHHRPRPLHGGGDQGERAGRQPR